MRILLTGKTGQIGYELERGLQGPGEIVALAAGAGSLYAAPLPAQLKGFEF